MPGYPWPVQPFDQQHPVRGFFHDPRIGDNGGSSFHTGIDVSAPDGTAVHAVAPGRVFIEGAQNVAVAQGGRDFGYWHIIPSVSDGDHVALNDVIGHVAPGWGHVHLAERTADPAPHGTYWNPLRPGAITPFADFGAPVVAKIVTSRSRQALYGDVDLIAEAFDRTPISVPPPWHGIPVTPARLRWRLVRQAQQVVPWTVALDSRVSFRPNVVNNSDTHFGDVYAPGTRQNHPNQPGLFRFWLARKFDTRAHPDGDYRLDVEASDVRGNASRAHLVVTFANEEV
jgi:Peptidase family M23